MQQGNKYYNRMLTMYFKYYIAKYINAACILRKNNYEEKIHFDDAVFK
jgi:hypothetical protein